MPTNFKHGSKAVVFLNGRDVSSYVSSIGTTANLDTAPIDTMGGTYKQSVTGLVGSELSLQGYFDPTQDNIFSTAVSNGNNGTKSIYIYTPQGNLTPGGAVLGAGVANACFCSDSWPTSYEVSTDTGGAGTFSAGFSSEAGLDDCYLCHELKNEAAGSSSNYVTMSAAKTLTSATVEDYNAYLIAPGSTDGGTANASLAVKIQTATTSGGSYVDVTGGAFQTVSTQSNFQKISFTKSQTLNQFVKVTWTGAGNFAVAVTRW